MYTTSYPINNNDGHLFTAHYGLVFSGLESIITLIVNVCAHLFNMRATHCTIWASDHRLLAYTFNFQVPNCKCTFLGGTRRVVLHAVPTYIQ